MRASGILMHITSLPGPYGIGTLGKEAYDFVDFLAVSGQRYWQVLPLTPTGYGNSPYQSCSSRAGNPYLVDPGELYAAGLLTEAELAYCAAEQNDRVNYGWLYQTREKVLRKAFSRFSDHKALTAFCNNNPWLKPYATYMTLKSQYGGAAWYQWDAPAKACRGIPPQALPPEELDFHCFVQYLFHLQWERLRDYAHSKGISIVGDVPIYVPYDSVEIWTEPEQFALDASGTPYAIAGCPPDSFSDRGQLWGNPLYNWTRMQIDGYRWWLQRLHAAAERYDVIRLDHFRGFERYYAIPYGANDATKGVWVPGPGRKFLQAVKNALPTAAFIAEDLGLLTASVHQLREQFACPGMKVLEFAFDGNKNNPYLPHTYDQNTVCYTGTHDNMPLRQWLAESPENALEYANRYMGNPESPVWGMLRLCHSSPADLAMVQMQDYLELGSEGRMNHPGTCNPENWSWRARPGFCTADLAGRIRTLTDTYGRLCTTV